MVVPVAWLIVKDPQLVDGFLHFAGKNNASTVDITAIMLGAGVWPVADHADWRAN